MMSCKGLPAHKAVFNFFNDNKAIFNFKTAIFTLNSSKLTPIYKADFREIYVSIHTRNAIY